MKGSFAGKGLRILRGTEESRSTAETLDEALREMRPVLSKKDSAFWAYLFRCYLLLDEFGQFRTGSGNSALHTVNEALIQYEDELLANPGGQENAGAGVSSQYCRDAAKSVMAAHRPALVAAFPGMQTTSSIFVMALHAALRIRSRSLAECLAELVELPESQVPAPDPSHGFSPTIEYTKRAQVVEEMTRMGYPSNLLMNTYFSAKGVTEPEFVEPDSYDELERSTTSLGGDAMSPLASIRFYRLAVEFESVVRRLAVAHPVLLATLLPVLIGKLQSESKSYAECIGRLYGLGNRRSAWLTAIEQAQCRAFVLRNLYGLSCEEIFAALIDQSRADFVLWTAPSRVESAIDEARSRLPKWEGMEEDWSWMQDFYAVLMFRATRSHSNHLDIILEDWRNE